MAFESGKDVAKAVYYSITDEHDTSDWDTDDWQRVIDMAIDMLEETGVISKYDVRMLISWAMEDSEVWEVLETAPIRLIAAAIQAEHELGDWAI